jgi:hypothetical protein
MYLAGTCLTACRLVRPTVRAGKPPTLMGSNKVASKRKFGHGNVAHAVRGPGKGPAPVSLAVQQLQQDNDPTQLKKRVLALHIGYMGTNYRGAATHLFRLVRGSEAVRIALMLGLRQLQFCCRLANDDRRKSERQSGESRRRCVGFRSNEGGLHAQGELWAPKQGRMDQEQPNRQRGALHRNSGRAQNALPR